jgi:hypothetical protein
LAAYLADTSVADHEADFGMSQVKVPDAGGKFYRHYVLLSIWRDTPPFATILGHFY